VLGGPGGHAAAHYARSVPTKTVVLELAPQPSRSSQPKRCQQQVCSSLEDLALSPFHFVRIHAGSDSGFGVQPPLRRA
jgi:hypothetical protein